MKIEARSIGHGKAVLESITDAGDRLRRGAATEGDFRLLHRTFDQPDIDSGKAVLYANTPEALERAEEIRNRPKEKRQWPNF